MFGALLELVLGCERWRYDGEIDCVCERVRVEVWNYIGGIYVTEVLMRHCSLGIGTASKRMESTLQRNMFLEY